MRLFVRRPIVAVALLIALVFRADILAVVPVESGIPSAVFPVAINTDAGDQFFGHLDGDIATYAYFSADYFVGKIGYYNFFTGETAFVPQPSGLSVYDYWPDISGTKITFWRQEVADNVSEAILVHDIATNTTTDVVRIVGAPGYEGGLSFPSIGGNTIAYVDLRSAYGEVFVANIANPAAPPTRLTNNALDDPRFERYIEVAPSGNVVVWQSCPPLSGANCDIEKATLTGSTWTVSRITTTTDVEQWVTTDGTLIVYNKYPPPTPTWGDSKICWQPVAGGAEECLVMAGSQTGPSVAGGVIAFSNTPPGAPEADLYVYEMATNRVFQITSTEGANEELASVARLPDGRIRVVWDDGAFLWPDYHRNIYGATIELPPVNTFTFSGFQQPIDAPPTLNVLKAGAAVPVRFSLGGFQGLGIFADGYPKSQLINCNSTVPQDDVEQTATAGGSLLSYDPATDRYSYIWKTERSWAGTCRQLLVRFTDGTESYANFRFR